MAIRIEFDTITADLVKGFRLAGRESDVLERKLGKTAKETLSVRDAALKLERAQAAAGRAAKRYHADHIKSAEATMRVEKAQERLNHELREATGANAALAASEARVSAAHARSEAARARAIASTRRFGASLLTLTRRTAMAGAAVAGIGIGLGVKNAVGFEQQMSRVQAKLLLTKDEMAGLNRLAIRLGADTEFSASEAALAMEELAAAGYGAHRIFKVLPGTMALASAAGTDLAQAAAIQTSTLNAFNLSMRDASRVADVLAQTANASAADIDDMQESLKYVAPVAKVSGQSLEGVMAAIGLMANVSIKGSQAGTTLRTALVRLQAPTRPVTEALRDFGLEIRDLQGPRGLLPLPEIIGKIVSGARGMEVAARNGAIARIFGREALSGVVTLVDRGEASYRRMQRALEDSTGASRRAQAIMRDNVAGAWDQFTGAVEASSIALLDRFMPSIQTALRDGAGDIDKLTGSAGQFLDGLTGQRQAWGEATTDAREMGEAVREVADALGDVASATRDVTFAIGGFAAQNPELLKVAGTLAGIALSVKAIRFAGNLTGVSGLIAMSRARGGAGGRLPGAAGAAGDAALPAIVAGGSAREAATVRQLLRRYRSDVQRGGGRGLALRGLAGAAARGRGGALAVGLGAGLIGTAMASPDRLSLGGVLGGAMGGAATGAVAGPWGAAGGALVGAASSALVGALRGSETERRRQEAEDRAREWALEFTGAIADNVARGMDRRRARRLAEAIGEARESRAGRRIDAALDPMSRVSRGLRPYSRQAIAEMMEGKGPAWARLDPRDLQQAQRDGRRVTDAFLAGQGRKFTTGRFLLQDFRATFGRLNPIAQQMGANALIRYARGLERSGRVARGTTRRLLAGLGRDFDGLAPRVAGATARTRRELERLGRNDRVIRSTQRLIERLTGLNGFASLPRATARSVQGSAATLRTYIDELVSITSDKNAPKAMREQAARELPGLRQAYRGALDQLAGSFGGSRRAADQWARRLSAATRDSKDRAERVRTLRDGVNQLTDRLRDGSHQAEVMARQLDTLRASMEGVAGVAQSMPDLSGFATVTPTSPRRNRRGGTIPRFNVGGLVPAFVSSGEEIVEPGGRSWIVPGPPTAADNVFTHLPVGSQVFTAHGQHLKASGLSASAALAMQAPHFARGGTVRTGYTVFDDPPPGAYGGGAKGLNNGYAELGTAVGNTVTGTGNFARLIGMKGELPVNFPLTIEINGKSKTLIKRDRGFGQKGDGKGGGGSDSRYSIDIWKDSWPFFGLNSSSRGIARVRTGRVGASFSYLRAPAITRSRTLDLMQPYGATDAFQQGFDAGVSGTRRLFRNWRGLDTDLFRSATSGVRANDRDRPKRIRIDALARKSKAKLSGRGLQLPASFTATHQTAGLAGYPAVDIFARPGTPVLSPADGRISRLSGGLNTYTGPGGPYGYSIYLDSSRGSYYMTHLGSRVVRAGQRVRYGQPIGTVGDYPNADSDHIHIGRRGYAKGGVVRRLRSGGTAGCAICGGAHATFRCGGIARFQGGGAVGQVVNTTATPGGGRRNRRASVGRFVAKLSDIAGLLDLIGGAAEGADGVVDAMRALATKLESTRRVSYRRLERLRGSVQREIVGLMRGGETGQERIQIRRLRGVLTLLEGEMGKRVGLVVGRAQRLVDAIDIRSGRVSTRLALAGTDESSVAGIQALLGADRTSRRSLRDQVGRLEQQLARARRMREADAVRAIREQIRTVRDAMTGLAVNVATRVRDLAAARAEEMHGRVALAMEQGTRTMDAISISQRRRGVSSESIAGIRERLGGMGHQRLLLEEQLPRAAALIARVVRETGLGSTATREAIRAYGLLRDSIDGLDADLAELHRQLAQTERYQPIDVRLALAQLTRETADDMGALREQQQLLQEDLAAAQGRGDAEAIIDLAGRLAGVQSTLESLDQTLQDRERQEQERDALMREYVDNQRRLLAVAEGEGDRVTSLLAAAINGSIGGRVGLGYQTPFFPGQGPRY